MKRFRSLHVRARAMSVVSLVITFGCGISVGQVQQSWVARYDGPEHASDSACCVSVNEVGNVYVFGPSRDGTADGVSALIKYDNTGNRLWVAHDSGAYPNFAIPWMSGRHSLATDGAGNAYVTGVYWPATNSSPDITTAKYDGDGVKLWSARFNGAPGYSYDAPSGLAVDKAGNVYVTGFSGGMSSTEDFVTIRYDSNGTQSWFRRYNGTGNSQDIASAIVVDASGNVYVTGWSIGSGTQQDFLTIKYDPAGNELWTARYDGPFHSVDEAVALAVDGAGNVYVVGRSVGSGACAGSSDSACQDITLVKYDTQGTRLWVARHERLGRFEQATDLAVDNAGHVYVSGSYGAGIIKYDANGNELWVSDFSAENYGTAMARALALDGVGNAYVTGAAHDGRSWIYMTAKYDPEGTRLWAARYNGPGSWGSRANALAVDAAGNIYVTGESATNDAQFSNDFATLKYSPINVAGLPVITMPPQSVAVSTGATVSMSVTATGQLPLSYGWRRDGQVWADSETPSVTLSNLSVTDIADWSVEVSNAVGVVVSRRARVIVQGPPEITYQSSYQNVFQGQSVTAIYVIAAGTPPLAFQWFKEGTLVGGNRSHLDLENVQASDAGIYTVIVTNFYGSVTSAPARLLVQSTSPAIIAQPQSRSIFIGGTASFNVTASGQAPLRYQWQHNGNYILNATNATLALTNVQPASAGDYRVIVANLNGTATSAWVRLTVIDSFPGWTNSTPIRIPDHGTADPSPSSIFVSGIPGEVPKVIVTLWGLSHTYASDVDVLLVGPSGQGVVLMSETGSASELSNVTLAFDDEAASFLPDEESILSGVFKPTNLYGTNDYFGQSAPPPPYAKTLSVFNGTNPNGQWRLYVFDNEEEDSGVIASGWSLDFGSDSPPRDLDPSALDKWHVRFFSPTDSPFGVTAYPGGFAAVTSSGGIITSPEGVDWTRRATSTNLPLSDVTFGSGTLVAVGTLGIIQTSSNGNAWARPTPATNITLNDVTYGGGERFVAVGEAGTIQISLDAGANWQAASSGTNRPLNGVAYGQGRFVAVGGGGVIVVSTNGLNWTPAVGVTNVTLWAVTYGAGKFVAVGDSRLILTSFDGVNWARQNGPVFNTPPLFDVIHANGQFVCVRTLATVLTSSDGSAWTSRAFPTTPFAPAIYSVAFNGDTFVAACPGSGTVLYQSDPVTLSPPRIVLTPRDTTVRLGGTTNLSVTVTGTSPFRYLWQQEDTWLAGATNRLLVFSNTQVSAEARYTVTVDNALGKITSPPVWLRVGVPPSFILQPQNQEVVPGGDATFSVQVAGTSPFDFHWRQPGSIYAVRHDPGRQSFWSVHRVEPAQAGVYGVVVSNNFGFLTSRPARLTLVADYDADGLPDAWEAGHGLSTNELADATLDFDGDGMNNLDEYRAGTNPTNAASLLSLHLTTTNGLVTVAFDAESNKTYTVQHAVALNATSWSKWVDFAGWTNRRVETLIDSPWTTNRFYRLVSPRQP